MLGDNSLDRIEESWDIGDVPHLDFPEALAPCLHWLQSAATRRRILEDLSGTVILTPTQHFSVPSAGHVFCASTGFGLACPGCDMEHRTSCC